MCCLCAESKEAVGPYGINAASEYAEDIRHRWKGIGSDMQKTREAGMYNCDSTEQTRMNSERLRDLHSILPL